MTEIDYKQTYWPLSEPCVVCGGKRTDPTAPMHKECFTCDGRHHWIDMSGWGGVLVTRCIDLQCGWSVVD